MSITLLDYPSHRIEMDITTEIEKAYRVTACAKEPWTVAFIEQIPEESCFVDIGANVGSYTLVARANDLMAVAIEPSFSNYAALCRNLALNGWLDRVRPIFGALGSRTGWTWLHYADMLSGAAQHVIGDQGKLSFHKQSVPVWTLPDLINSLGIGAPLYLKLDVDGGEMEILKGAEPFLQSGRVQGIITETVLTEEQAMCDYMTSVGFVSPSRFDKREGATIANIAYRLFVKA